MLVYGPPEKVHVENEWYDGPRAGVADIAGMPHRFISEFDEVEDDYCDVFIVWPITEKNLELEIEQWRIFVAWNSRFESGQCGTDSHPAVGGIDPRWDEIESILEIDRKEIPDGARKARAKFIRLKTANRYGLDGPDYKLQWSVQ